MLIILLANGFHFSKAPVCLFNYDGFASVLLEHFNLEDKVKLDGWVMFMAPGDMYPVRRVQELIPRQRYIKGNVMLGGVGGKSRGARFGLSLERRLRAFRPWIPAELL